MASPWLKDGAVCASAPEIARPGGQTGLAVCLFRRLPLRVIAATRLKGLPN